MITLLAGGTGSVKLARGISKMRDDLTVISNIADNIWFHGLYICPDIDTITYGLAYILDKKRGWGVMDDSFMFMEQMIKLGQDYWFKIGDKDLALHIVRTNFLNKGKSLSWITEWIRKKFAISSRIIPASDDHVETRIETSQGEMHIQEFWVKNHAELDITYIRYKGIETATANSRAVESIKNSELVIIAPGNPISSIGPIISLPIIRKELESKKDSVIAVSPIVGNSPLSGPASKYMQVMGMESSAFGIASYYKDIASNLVISRMDDEYQYKINKLGINVYKTNIVMQNLQDEITLSNYILSNFSKA
ncbi:MAG: 2-phospho-L-lactate transferase [Nitrososphaeraceae archaeon]